MRFKTFIKSRLKTAAYFFYLTHIVYNLNFRISKMGFLFICAIYTFVEQDI